MNWDTLVADCVDFAQRLIQTPSMPGEEAQIAALVIAEMGKLNFDQVWLDDVGNACGRIEGDSRNRGAIVLNTHLDHVDPGDPALWSVPPYSGQIVDGRIWGRGACDIKGPLAVQIYSMAALQREGVKPRRDVVFTGVVQEETGGAGAIYWVENLDYAVDLVVLGEPSNNQIALGHRGGYWFWVTFHGRSVHASVPDKGDNPNYALATFLSRLETEQHTLSTHPVLGQTTVAPTIVAVDTSSKNVTPAWTRVLLDCRTATESPKSLTDFVHRVAEGLNISIREGLFNGEVEDSDTPISGFYTPPDSSVVQRAKTLISQGIGHEVALSNYRFATDGRHFVPYNLPMIGYAAGEELLAHTAQESISIEMMAESLRGYVQLLREF